MSVATSILSSACSAVSPGSSLNAKVPRVRFSATAQNITGSRNATAAARFRRASCRRSFAILLPRFALHPHLARFNLMLPVPLSRGWRETQALEQAHRAKIRAFEHGGEIVYLIALDQLGDHGLDSLPREPATPVSAGQFVGDGRAALGVHGCLNIADQLGTRKADDPVEPLFLAIRRQPRLELREPGAQPFDRRRRFALVLVDRRVAEDSEHLMRMRRGLRLQREAVSLDHAHHFASSSCLAAFRSRMTHCASASNLA